MVEATGRKSSHKHRLVLKVTYQLMFLDLPLPLVDIHTPSFGTLTYTVHQLCFGMYDLYTFSLPSFDAVPCVWEVQISDSCSLVCELAFSYIACSFH